MKAILRFTLTALTLFYVSSCDFLNQIQLFPQEITTMEASLDLSEKFGVYEISGDEKPFEMLYLETQNRKLIFINSMHSSEGSPNALVIDAETLNILMEFNTHLNLFNMQPGLVYPNSGVDNEIISDSNLSDDFRITWIRQAFTDGTNLLWDSLLFILDATEGAENVFVFEVINEENTEMTIDYPTALSLELKAEMIFGTRDIETDSWTERQLVDTPATLVLSFPNTYHPAGAVNDIKEGKSFFYGFSPVNADSYGAYNMNNQVQVNSTFTIYEINPTTPSLVRTIQLENSSNYSWYNVNYPSFIHKADLHYTRKGWVLKKEGSGGYPQYILHASDTGNELNQDSVPAANALAACFDFSGEHYYYIDLRSLKLIKAVTPW